MELLHHDVLKGPSTKRRQEVTLYSLIKESAPTISSNETVGVARTYVESRNGHYLVVTKQSKIVGVVCACDLGLAKKSAKVDTCIQGPLILVSSTESLHAAAAIMRNEGVGCLPIMFRNKMLGIVTRTHFRNAGFTHKSLSDIPICSACHSDEHVRLTDDCILMSFCRECMDHMDEFIPHADCGGEG